MARKPAEKANPELELAREKTRQIHIQEIWKTVRMIAATAIMAAAAWRIGAWPAPLRMFGQADATDSTTPPAIGRIFQQSSGLKKSSEMRFESLPAPSQRLLGDAIGAEHYTDEDPDIAPQSPSTSAANGPGHLGSTERTFGAPRRTNQVQFRGSAAHPPWSVQVNRTTLVGSELGIAAQANDQPSAEIWDAESARCPLPLAALLQQRP